MYGGDVVGAALVVFGNRIISTRNGNDGAASLTAVVHLGQGDEVCMRNHRWVSGSAIYNKSFTTWSGVLLHGDV